jgi:four helix bundle protein
MAITRSFRELEVYKLARVESGKIFELTKGFPREEKFSLIDQIRRSSRAVGAMLAAAWARRRYRAAFVSKLDEALEEAMETQAWLDHSLDCKYLTGQEYLARDASWQRVGAMLNRMMDRADDFCKLAPDHTSRPASQRPE